MPAGGEIYLSGYYEATWHDLDLGTMKGDGKTFTFVHLASPINKTDKWGDCVIDKINRGRRTFIQFHCLEWLQGIQDAIEPFADELGELAVIGSPHYDDAYPLILTATAGTPSAGLIASITIPKAVIAENFDVNLLLGPDAHGVPIRMEGLLAELDNNKLGHFVFA